MRVGPAPRLPPVRLHCTHPATGRGGLGCSGAAWSRDGIIFALTPTVVVGLIFWFVMRAIMRADRTERSAYAKVEAEERARFEREHGVPAPAPTSAE